MSDEAKNYDRLRGKKSFTPKPAVAILFDMFYPLLAASLILCAITWYLDMPLNRIVEVSVGDVLRKLHF